MRDKIGIGTNTADANIHLKNRNINDEQLKMRFSHMFEMWENWGTTQEEPLTYQTKGENKGGEITIKNTDIFNKYGNIYFAIDGENKFGISSTTLQMNVKILCMDKIISKKNVYVYDSLSVGDGYSASRPIPARLYVSGTTLLEGNTVIGTIESPANLSINGKVSIGTTATSENLNIKGNILLESTTSHQGTSFKIEQYTTQHPNGSYTDWFQMYFNNNTVSRIKYQQNGTLMLIGGNFTLFDEVGTQEISMNTDGTIWANKKIVVTNSKNWPDFLFEEDYILKPLNEVEKYIKEFKHLEGVPSSADINANGINLGDMTNILTQKVEELTLYIIEINKKVEKLEIENQELKNQLMK